MAKQVKITTMTFQLSVEMKKKLKQVATRKGVTLRKLINDAIAKIR